MKFCVLTTLSWSALLLSTQVFALNLSEVTAEEAKNKVFTGNLCNKKYYAFIKFPSVTGSGSWPKGGTGDDVDQVIADTETACKAAEKKVKDALNAMKASWYKKCKADGCAPGSHTHSSDFGPLAGGGATNCAYGEVTVTNVDNPAMSCNYPVQKGKAYPGKLGDRGSERCFNGEEGGVEGYGGATVSIPASHRNGKYYMSLTCHLTTTRFDLRIFDEYDPPEVVPPKEEPPKSDDPKDGK